MERIVTAREAKSAIATSLSMLAGIKLYPDPESVAFWQKIHDSLEQLSDFMDRAIDNDARKTVTPQLDANTHHLGNKLDRIIELLQQTAGPKTATATVKQRWVPAVGDMCLGPLGVGTVIRVLAATQSALVEFEAMDIKNKPHHPKNITWVDWSKLTPFE